MNQNQKKALCGLFDRASDTYDNVGPRFFSYFGKRIVEVAGILGGARVLDLATGRGASLYPALEAVGARGFVTGIDLSRRMVEKTGGDIARRAISNAKVLCMDAECLDFPGGSFDAVIAEFCVFFFPDPAKAFSEMFRVLKPGGTLTLSTWGTYPSRDWHIELAGKYFPPDSPSAMPQENRKRPFEDPAEVRQALALAGFDRVSTTMEDKEFVYSSEEEWWATQYSHGIRATLERIESKLGAEGLARFKQDAFTHLQSLKQPAGFVQTMRVYYTSAIKQK